MRVFHFENTNLKCVEEKKKANTLVPAFFFINDFHKANGILHTGFLLIR